MVELTAAPQLKIGFGGAGSSGIFRQWEVAMKEAAAAPQGGREGGEGGSGITIEILDNSRKGAECEGGLWMDGRDTLLPMPTQSHVLHSVLIQGSPSKIADS